MKTYLFIAKAAQGSMKSQSSLLGTIQKHFPNSIFFSPTQDQCNFSCLFPRCYLRQYLPHLVNFTIFLVVLLGSFQRTNEFYFFTSSKYLSILNKITFQWMSLMIFMS